MNLAASDGVVDSSRLAALATMKEVIFNRMRRYGAAG
jgi:hypothetical protein